MNCSDVADLERGLVKQYADYHHQLSALMSSGIVDAEPVNRKANTKESNPLTKQHKVGSPIRLSTHLTRQQHSKSSDALPVQDMRARSTSSPLRLSKGGDGPFRLPRMSSVPEGLHVCCGVHHS